MVKVAVCLCDHPVEGLPFCPPLKSSGGAEWWLTPSPPKGLQHSSLSSHYYLSQGAASPSDVTDAKSPYGKISRFPYAELPFWCHVAQFYVTSSHACFEPVPRFDTGVIRAPVPIGLNCDEKCSSAS